MRFSAVDSFRAQIALIGLASVSIAALAIILIRDVVSSTEQTLLGEAQQQCLAAAAELRLQLEDRAAFQEDPLETLPPEIQDFSLRGLAATVLRSYDGLRGGFLSSDAILGAADPASADGVARLLDFETDLIHRVVSRSLATGEPAVEAGRHDNDLVVAAAQSSASGGSTAWTMRRLAGAGDPVARGRQLWLAGLVLMALLGVGGVISISIRLRRGVDEISAGLRRLEKDFIFRLPSISGDFGAIGRAINQMAERRTQLEGEIRRQDRLAALGKVVAGVAHEIRNPLNSIRLSLELLDRRVQRGKATTNEVSAAIAEVDRLDRILARLLAFGQPGLEDRHPQSIAPLVEHAIEMTREPSQRKNLQIIFDHAKIAGLQADVDGLQFEQVLINLLINAIEASPPAGTIEVGGDAEVSRVCIFVRDHGEGIPEKAKHHVFDPYFTTKETGNGLGLAVSREVVVNHGGDLNFESDSSGTTFRACFPLSRSAA